MINHQLLKVQRLNIEYLFFLYFSWYFFLNEFLWKINTSIYQRLSLNTNPINPSKGLLSIFVFLRMYSGKIKLYKQLSSSFKVEAT